MHCDSADHKDKYDAGADSAECIERNSKRFCHQSNRQKKTCYQLEKVGTYAKEKLILDEHIYLAICSHVIMLQNCGA